MPPFLTSLAAKLVGVALIAAGAAIFTGWTVHKVDDDSYKALQLADANALNVQMQKDNDAAQKFNERAATAMEATASKLKTLSAQRSTAAQQLATTLTVEGKKDAALDTCLAMQLPADVLQQLPR